MDADLQFLTDVEALAEFVSVLDIDSELRGRVERIRCDVHQMKVERAARERKRRLRDSVKRQTYAGAR